MRELEITSQPLAEDEQLDLGDFVYIDVPEDDKQIACVVLMVHGDKVIVKYMFQAVARIMDRKDIKTKTSLNAPWWWFT